MARTTTEALRGVLLLAALLLTVGCSEHGGTAVDEDVRLSTELSELRKNGGSVPFRELAGTDWDSVYVSHHPVTRDYLEKQVGGELDMDAEFLQRGNVLVFLAQGRVVRASYITPDLLPPGRYPAEARLTAPGYPALLELSPAR